jgi:hypothetical protein
MTITNNVCLAGISTKKTTLKASSGCINSGCGNLINSSHSRFDGATHDFNLISASLTL